MDINLVELEHQSAALEQILKNMPPLNLSASENLYSNPLLEFAGDEKHFIDIKMETGTGKTYVYTRTMYELHRQLGMNKFIIVVPSIPIKEGTKNFILSSYAKKHFARIYQNVRLELYTINSGDFSTKKSKRKMIPPAIVQFCEASRADKNTIHCLLICDKGYLDSNTYSLFKDDYDQTLYGGYNSPIEGIKSTKPIVIIDEPHRFKRNGKTYGNIISGIDPQIIIRFGATFPVISTGRGKNKIEQVDYYRGVPQYDLNAVKAFNQDLVKGVSIEFPNVDDCKKNKYKVKKVTDKLLVLKQGNKEWEIEINEDLSKVNNGFDGDVRYDGNKRLTNGLELHEGMDIIDVSDISYQELLIQQAIDAHFEKEIANFNRNGYKIKTISLFFIDSISSYRDDDGWLKNIFEKKLADKLIDLLKEYTTGEYHQYLQASIKNIKLCHGGYFAKDRKDGSDWGENDPTGTKEEVADVLHKERTLKFKKENGDWNLRRFFFSKWTLREGWDNPNVFNICKLRSSGSENSKIQEVGRGLRLPVDEVGNRIVQDWKLNFIVGWDEKDFAAKLVSEINSQAALKINQVKLTDDVIELICKETNQERKTLLEALYRENIIDIDKNFEEGGYNKLINIYPVIVQNQLKPNKITKNKKSKKIKLRQENWEKIKDLWKVISKRYMICLSRLSDKDIELILNPILVDALVANDSISTTVMDVSKTESADSVALRTGVKAVKNISGYGRIQYPEFVKRISLNTSLPIHLIHKLLWQRLCELSKTGLQNSEINAMLNTESLRNICQHWKTSFIQTFATKYEYNSLNYNINTSVLKDGNFVTEIEQGLLGCYIANDLQEDTRNLYDYPIAFDSQIEYKIEQIIPPSQIFIFGKLPKCSIKVPTYVGGSTTPDFIFVTKGDSQEKVTLLVETKADDIRESERTVIESQQRKFSNLANIRWELITEPAQILSILKSLK